ncbi:hypothetical protein AB0M37_16025 [Micromonospora chalcea]
MIDDVAQGMAIDNIEFAAATDSISGQPRWKRRKGPAASATEAGPFRR